MQTNRQASRPALHWHVPRGSSVAHLRGDWTGLGEHREVVPIEDLAQMLGATATDGASARLAAQLSSTGSWVFYARRLKEHASAWADVLVQAGTATDEELSGTVSDVTERLGGLGAKGHTDAERLLTFAQHLTQDLRIPLRQIFDCHEMLRASLADPAEVLRWLHHAESSLARARSVVGDAFDLLQVVGGRSPVNFEALSLAVMVPAHARLHEPAAAAAEKRLQIDVFEDTNAVVDFAALTAVLDNLLSNAIRHTPPGTTVAVTVGRDEAGTPLVTVSDDGKGLTDAHLARLFEPFFRGSLHPTSSGLGLVLVLELCRLMQASVLLRRNSAGGLTAEVRLLSPERRTATEAAALT